MSVDKNRERVVREAMLKGLWSLQVDKESSFREECNRDILTWKMTDHELRSMLNKQFREILEMNRWEEIAEELDKIKSETN